MHLSAALDGVRGSEARWRKSGELCISTWMPFTPLWSSAIIQNIAGVRLLLVSIPREAEDGAWY
jgi:hypothetical protein